MTMVVVMVGHSEWWAFMNGEPGQAGGPKSFSRGRAFCQVLQLNQKASLRQSLVKDLFHVDRDYMNIREWDGIGGVKCILLAETEMLMMLFAWEGIPGTVLCD